ncbi:MAG: hypothetical protein KAS72_12220 [Phycisphaerales bacterium]|nr:hypothetical protein [Phycisphaerales bacterium]
MRIYAVQLDIVWEDKRANHELVRSMLAQADPEPDSLVVLPEMFDTGFSLDVERTDDGRNGLSERFCSELARKLGVYVQGARTTIEPDGWARNWAVTFTPQGKPITRYAKLHPFGFGQEAERFVGGDELTAYRWQSGDQSLVVSPLICYDLRFPEAFRLATLDLGAELFTIGANWPAERKSHWRSLLIARAIENQAYVVGVNRCGSDPRLSYAGGSLIVDPQGEILAEAGAEPIVLTADVDSQAVGAWRSAFGALRDIRRPMLGEAPGLSDKP